MAKAKINSIVIAVDCGKMNLKAKGEIDGVVKEIYYKNAYSLQTGDAGMLGANTFNVEHENQHYIVGERANNMMFGEGKDDEHHILSTLVAITHFLDAEKNKGDDVVLVYGESWSRYNNSKHKQEIKNKFEKRHIITVGGVEYDFNIRLVHILPEGIGHILQDLDRFSGIQYVVDIGGTTINYLTVNNGLPIPERSTSLELGTHTLRTNIIKAMTENDMARLDEVKIDEYIEKNNCKKKEVTNIIEDCILAQFQELDVKLAGFKVDLHKVLEIDDVIFIGGGSETLKERIKDYYRGATVLDEAMLMNVRGFYTYGVAKYGNFR